jgi:hypothetical protein
MSTGMYIERCRRFIESVGTLNLASQLGVSASAVSNWKQRGIPTPYIKYLKLIYKTEWGLLEEKKNELHICQE